LVGIVGENIPATQEDFRSIGIGEPTYSHALELLKPYLDRLPEKQRRRFMLREGDGLKFSEITRQERCRNNQTINQSVKRALRKLQKMILSDGKKLEDFAD
jgi:DNA-directed RNA polymerase specialized sigma24 family protein